MGKRTGRWKGVIYEDKDSRGEVLGASNVTPQVQHLDENYVFQPCKETETTRQGLLVVARLEPKMGTLPRFSFRWDDKEGNLDVDIHGASNAERDSFRNGQNGYSGHHTQKVDDKGRAFDSVIVIPGRRVFKGRFTFNLSFGEKVGDVVRAKAGAEDSLSLGPVSERNVE
jgi:hypothetical protein